nr:hypothetical protein [Tanacetum cinerariifolium]
IVDFLNGHVIQYALMVNPTIYVSCIKQFWATVSIKKVNDVVKLRALINGNRVVKSEDVIRQDLCLDDADGVECLPNEEIFTKLAHMGYEKPPPKLTAKRMAWKEFSFSMASAVICLATGRKFNFLKYIFDSMYISHALTQKVFANMCRVGKGFSRVETPLFATMIVQPPPPAIEEEANVEGRKEDDNAAIKNVSTAEPNIFDDEEVTMNMAQTLIKMKAKKARLLDEQMAKRLHDKEIKQAAAREKQEKDDLEKAKVLQKQYVDKQDNIDWNVVDVEEP